MINRSKFYSQAKTHMHTAPIIRLGSHGKCVLNDCELYLWQKDYGELTCLKQFLL